MTPIDDPSPDPELLREFAAGFAAIALDRPHDSLFRYVFGRTEHAASFLADALPPELSSRIDWSQLRLEPGTFVDERFVRRESDLLFTAPFLGSAHRIGIHLLFEHQSTFDRDALLRVLGYKVRIWNQWRDARTRIDDPLPPIVAIVLAHDPAPWRGPTRFDELYGLEADLRRRFGNRLVDFGIELVDLTSLPRTMLMARHRWTDLVRLVLALFRTVRSREDLIDSLRPFAGLFRTLASTPGGRRDVAALVRYLESVGDYDRPRMHSMLRLHAGPETTMAISTWAQQLIDEGLAKGLTKGRTEGRTEGRAIALVRLLERKFGPLPDDMRRRIDGASETDLDAFLDRIFDAGSLDEVLQSRS